MRAKISISLALAAMLLPLSCTKNAVQDGTTLPEGSRPPLELTVGDGPATRSSAGKTAWIPGTDRIHVSFAQPTGSGISLSEGFYKIKDSDGGTEPDGEPVLWQNTNPASVYAWYWPAEDFSAKIDISDQSTPEKVKAVDALSASVSDVKFGTKPNLGFGHALAKVRILWRDETLAFEGWGERFADEIVRASNARFFSNSLKVSLEKGSTGLYALTGDGDAGWIVPCPDETEKMTWECLVPAQTISGAAIKLTIKKGDEEPYKSAVFIEETAFEAGKTYSYTLVSDPLNSKIEIAVSNIYDWEAENGGSLALKSPIRLEKLPAKDGVVRIERDMDIRGETENTVEIADGCTVNLWGVKIHGGIITEGNVTIDVHGDDNLVETSEEGMPGIWPQSGGTLTIKGPDKYQHWDSGISVLSERNAAAIGGGTKRPAGNIIITGNLYVKAAQKFTGGYGAGIGGGYDDAPCGDITISDEVWAGGDYYGIECSGMGAAIGGGAKNSGCGNISMMSSTIKALQIEGYGAAIGGGYDNSPCGNISIIKGKTFGETFIYANREDTKPNAKGSGIGGGVKNSGCGKIDFSHWQTYVYGPKEGSGVGDGVDNSPCQGIFIRTGLLSIDIHTYKGTSTISGELTIDGDFTVSESQDEDGRHCWSVNEK